MPYQLRWFDALRLWNNYEKRHDEKVEIEQKYDLIRDYFSLPDDYSGEAFNLTVSTLERAIGTYTAWKSRACKRLLNPIWWIAMLIHLPLRLLEMADLADEKTPAQLRTAYAWLIRIALLILISLAATKLGVSIPWQAILG